MYLSYIKKINEEKIQIINIKNVLNNKVSGKLMGTRNIKSVTQILFTFGVPFDFSRILRRVKSETLRVRKRVVL